MAFLRSASNGWCCRARLPAASDLTAGLRGLADEPGNAGVEVVTGIDVEPGTVGTVAVLHSPTPRLAIVLVVREAFLTLLIVSSCKVSRFDRAVSIAEALGELGIGSAATGVNFDVPQSAPRRWPVRFHDPHSVTRRSSSLIFAVAHGGRLRKGRRDVSLTRIRRVQDAKH